MDGYKHYIRIDSNNIVIDGYADWQEDKRGSGEIQLSGDIGRHFQIQLITDRGQFMYKLENGAMVQRSQTELDAEWATRPPEPKSDSELLKEARQEIGRLGRTIDSLSSDMQLVIDSITV